MAAFQRAGVDPIVIGWDDLAIPVMSVEAERLTLTHS